MTISPHEDAHFLREGVIDINAAVVGISKARWMGIEESEGTEEQAAAIMRLHRFDILPIVDGAEVKKYFYTDEWNDYSSISQKPVTHRDVLPFHTHIRDVIKGLAVESRDLYFLHNERRIVGLISVANLNCRQVKVYLFSLLSELEVRLADFIAKHISEDELLKMIFGAKEREKYEKVKERYQEDKMAGNDAHFVEYLYLSDMINIIAKQKLYEQLGYQSRTCFAKNLGSLNDLRHAVAHPSRSIVTDKHSVEKLWDRIDRVEEALFLLG
jgi:hypothetical protein